MIAHRRKEGQMMSREGAEIIESLMKSRLNYWRYKSQTLVCRISDNSNAGILNSMVRNYENSFMLRQARWFPDLQLTTSPGLLSFYLKDGSEIGSQGFNQIFKVIFPVPEDEKIPEDLEDDLKKVYNQLYQIIDVESEAAPFRRAVSSKGGTPSRKPELKRIREVQIKEPKELKELEEDKKSLLLKKPKIDSPSSVAVLLTSPKVRECASREAKAPYGYVWKVELARDQSITITRFFEPSFNLSSYLLSLQNKGRKELDLYPQDLRSISDVRTIEAGLVFEGMKVPTAHRHSVNSIVTALGSAFRLMFFVLNEKLEKKALQFLGNSIFNLYGSLPLSREPLLGFPEPEVVAAVQALCDLGSLPYAKTAAMGGAGSEVSEAALVSVPRPSDLLEKLPRDLSEVVPKVAEPVCSSLPFSSAFTHERRDASLSECSLLMNNYQVKRFSPSSLLGPCFSFYLSDSLDAKIQKGRAEQARLEQEYLELDYEWSDEDLDNL